MHQWRLLHHLPALPNLHIVICSDLTSSPEIIGALSSLRWLSVWMARGNHEAELPEWLGHLTSLEKLELKNSEIYNLQEIMGSLTFLQELHIRYCSSIESLPESIQQLTSLKKLQITGCPALQRWCEAEENKMKLAHIKEKVEFPILLLLFRFLIIPFLILKVLFCSAFRI
jgi:hypothetical protein